MATGILAEFCRLCATKKQTNLKNILNQQFKKYQNVIREVLSIEIKEDDRLPKNICIECEDKINSWQEFHLECTRNQVFLGHLCSLENEASLSSDVNEENNVVIKDESSFNNDIDGIISDYRDDTIFEGTTCYSEHDESSSDNLPIAFLKKHKTTKGNNSKDLNENKNPIKTNTKHKNKFIVYSCYICQEDCKNWLLLKKHFEVSHTELKTIVHCKCGLQLSSQKAVYKHIAEEHNTGIQKDKYVIQFICHICNKGFKNWVKLQQHCKKSHKDRPVVYCNFCGTALYSHTAMYSHLAAHRYNRFLCDVCSHVSSSQRALDKHKHSKHSSEEEKKYQCSTCEKIFDTKQLIKSHLKTHIPISERKVHKCDICDRKFTSRTSVMIHIRSVHLNVKRFICDLCGFNCATSGELRQHRPIHSDEKPFQCPKCNKGFKTKSNLITHMDIHEGTSYECHVCRRILNSRRTLRKHLLVHQPEYRFVCAHCKRAFKRRETLKTHLSVHTGDKPFTCKHCNERFTYASTLRAHRLRYHSDKPLQNSSTNHIPQGGAAVANCIGYAPDDNASQMSLNVSKKLDPKMGYLRIDWS